MSEQTAPVFVIGSIRSGASLLSLSLSQHPQLRAVMENRWLEEFIAGLLRGYKAASETRATSQIDINGIELESFLAHFGASAHDLMATSSGFDDQQVVDSTPANVFLVAPLRMLFPTAKFIHVVRDAQGVVSTLTDPELRLAYKSRHVLCSPPQAVNHWFQAVSAGVAAERAFGSDVVLRVRRAALIADPEHTLRCCLEFLGVSHDTVCLRPFSSISPETVRESSFDRLAGDESMQEAFELSSWVIDETTAFLPDERAIDQLTTELWQRAMRGQPLVPPIPGTRAAVKLEQSRLRRQRARSTPNGQTPETALARFARMMLGQRSPIANSKARKAG